MKITVKNNEFFVNLLNYETAKAYEDGAERLTKLAEELEPIPKLSDKIARGCEVISDVIDSVLGEGTTEKLFNGRKALDEYAQTWFEITEKISKGAKKDQEASQRALTQLKAKKLHA